MAETIIKKSGGGIGRTILIIVILALIAGGIYYFFFRGGVSSSSVVDSSKFQAVFLTNGQVYFGKVSKENSDYVSMAEVYYLVLKKPLQNQQKDENQTADKPEYSLVKLGQEMHGPTSMSINHDQILFIENLADDSKVVTAIKSGNK